MKGVFRSRKRKDAQTLVFFLLAWGTIMLLCGLAIDSGLLYLAKARLARAVDGAALAAVGNFNRNSDPATNRDDVAVIMRNFAAANFTDLSSISGTAQPHGGTATPYTLPNGTKGTTYTYSFNDGTQDAGTGQYKRFVQVVLNTGSGGAITSATCNARCPVQTYFIGYATYAIGGRQNVKIGGYSGPSGLVDLKVSSSAVATRNPRLIMVVVDRSASMLQPGGGASGLPPAVVQFLDFFDTSSDNIGIVSFGSSARLEMPLTTNFIIAGTNNLIDAYETNGIGDAEPGVDPESISGSAVYDANYATTGVRRLKFGGDTAADDGIRLAIEQLMGNAGFNDPDVVKYMVIFTDGKWNASRTMVAAPGYTNEVTVPTFTLAQSATNKFVTNTMANAMTNGQEYIVSGSTTNYGPWSANVTTNMSPTNDNLLLMPTLCPLPGVTNAIADPATNDYANLVPNHLPDKWLSTDTSGYEPFGSGGTLVTDSLVATNTAGPLTNYYTHNFDVWLQPGSVAYYYASAVSSPVAYVSDYTHPTKHINLTVPSGGRVDLVVPGYVADGVVYDGIDLNYPDNPAYGISGYPRFRVDNYQQQYMWPDDTGGVDPNGTYYTASLQRQLVFRNYANLLTGFYVFRPDEPVGGGFEPLITEDNPPGAPRPRYGLGAYYPSAGFYWPFGGETDNNGFVTNAVGVDVDATYGLLNPNSGQSGQSRHIAYSINMLSTNAAPEWAGELFYKSASGAGTNTISGLSATSASQVMQSSDWQNGAPGFVSTFAGISGLMTNEASHNTNIVGSPSVWRPTAFNGSTFTPVSSTLSITPGNVQSLTGGWVSDGKGHYYPNAMAWSGRPTHYFDFSQSKWVSVATNHTTNSQFLQMGNWKAWEYGWHARALGVTIYTVGYGTLVTDAQQLFLAQIANSTNTTAGGGSNISFNANQPIGQQFYATNAAQISNDFFQVGQAINAALTQ
jgi:Mg-chelatase subunit ChlD/Flp pilus assembly protein TadG